MTRSETDAAIAEIEQDQAALAQTIEESKQLLNRSQQLLDWHKAKATAKPPRR